MAITKTPITLLAAGAVAPGSTKAVPGRDSGPIDVRSYTGGNGLLTYAITNGASAPGAPVVLTFQVSTDGATWRDLWSVSGDTTANSTYSGTIDVPRAAMYVRAIAYGNTTNAVNVAAELIALTAP